MKVGRMSLFTLALAWLCMQGGPLRAQESADLNALPLDFLYENPAPGIDPVW
jgi:hypothetical protein